MCGFYFENALIMCDVNATKLILRLNRVLLNCLIARLETTMFSMYINCKNSTPIATALATAVQYDWLIVCVLAGWLVCLFVSFLCVHVRASMCTCVYVCTRERQHELWTIMVVFIPLIRSQLHSVSNFEFSSLFIVLFRHGSVDFLLRISNYSITWPVHSGKLSVLKYSSFSRCFYLVQSNRRVKMSKVRQFVDFWLRIGRDICINFMPNGLNTIVQMNVQTLMDYYLLGATSKSLSRIFRDLVCKAKRTHTQSNTVNYESWKKHLHKTAKQYNGSRILVSIL